MPWILFCIITFAPIVGALILHLCNVVGPRFIPDEEVIAEARRRLSKDGKKALERLAIDEDRAWRMSQTYEQYRLRRIGFKMIELDDEV